MINTALLHYCISRMAGLYFCIDGKAALCDRTIPDIMVTFTVPYKNTAVIM